MDTDLQANRYTPKYIPIQTLIDYANRGLNMSETAKIVGCTKSAISQAFKRHNYVPQHLKAYQASKADIYDHYQDMVLRSFTPEEIKKAPFSSRVMLFGVLYDKARLERGQSTSNIQSLSVIIEQAHKAKKAQPVVSPVEEAATSGAISTAAEDVQPIEEGEDAVQGQR